MSIDNCFVVAGISVGDDGGCGGTLDGVTALDPDAQRLLEHVVANSRLEGQDLPAEDLELARAYLSGEIDAAAYQARVRQLVEAEARRAESA